MFHFSQTHNVLQLTGEFDFVHAKELMDSLHTIKYIDRGLVVDLTQITSMHSSIVAPLVKLGTSIKKINGTLYVVKCPVELCFFLQQMNLNHLFSFCDSLEGLVVTSEKSVDTVSEPRRKSGSERPAIVEDLKPLLYKSPNPKTGKPNPSQ